MERVDSSTCVRNDEYIDNYQYKFSTRGTRLVVPGDLV